MAPRKWGKRERHERGKVHRAAPEGGLKKGKIIIGSRFQERGENSGSSGRVEGEPPL